jgi:hypothetical protein
VGGDGDGGRIFRRGGDGGCTIYHAHTHNGPCILRLNSPSDPSYPAHHMVIIGEFERTSESRQTVDWTCCVEEAVGGPSVGRETDRQIGRSVGR